MKLTVRIVESSYIHQTWPHVKHYIEAALDEGMPYPEGCLNYNADHVLGFLAGGHWMLLVATDEDNKLHGAATLSFVNYPLHRVAFVTTMGGKFVTGLDTAAQLKDIARSNGATKIQATARPSMAKLLEKSGFEQRNVIVETLI